MPNEWFFVYLLVATLYGYVMHKMGQTSGALALITVMVDSGIIKSQDSMNDKINEYYAAKEQE